MIKTETIIVDSGSPDTKFVKVKKEKETQGIIIEAVALSVLAFIMIIFCLRYLFLKNTQARLDIERKIERINKPVEMNNMSDNK